MNRKVRSIEEYRDIINLPHPESRSHPRMPMENRAAQFAPFAALTGYGDTVDRMTEKHEEVIANERTHEKDSDILNHEYFFGAD